MCPGQPDIFLSENYKLQIFVLQIAKCNCPELLSKFQNVGGANIWNRGKAVMGEIEILRCKLQIAKTILRCKTSFES